MRLLALLAAACLAAPVLAQAPAANAPREQLEPRGNKKVERIHIEDGGSRIDEVRVGGETQSVTVQPKADVPPYEMTPTDMLRSRPADAREGLSGATGKRVWNVLAF